MMSCRIGCCTEILKEDRPLPASQIIVDVHHRICATSGPCGGRRNNRDRRRHGEKRKECSTEHNEK